MEQLDLSDFIKTKAQALDFSIRLSLISQKFFETDFNLQKELLEQLGMHKADKFITLLRENKVNETAIESLKIFFNLLQMKITSLPVITMKLAIEPKEKTLQTLSQWFLLNVNKQVLFDITVDPEIIGGVDIYFDSKFLDFSVRTTFDKILKEITEAEKQKPVTVH